MDDDGLEDDIQSSPPAGLGNDLPESGAKSTHARLSRKRTKTGCLTCRRRRIKCGEERPTCGNCIKSKRQCEGYNQRVIFKDPLSTFRAPSSAAQTGTPFNARAVSGVPSTSQRSQFHLVQHMPQTSASSFAGDRSSSSKGQALANSSQPTGFPVKNGEADNRRDYEFHNQGDRGYQGTTGEISGSALNVHTNFDTAKPSFPHGVGMLNQQVQTKHGTHYDFNSLSSPDSNPGTTRLDQNFHLNWSHDSSIAEPPIHKSVCQSDIREAASSIQTQPYPENSNWPTYLSQYIPTTPKLSTHLLSQSPVTAPDHRLAPRSGGYSWKEAINTEKSSQEITTNQYDQELGPRNWIEREKLTSVATQYQDPIPSDTKIASPEVSARLGDRSTESFYPSGESLFDKSDDEMGLDERDQGMQVDFAKAQEDHLQNNDLGIVVALQASQDMQEQRLRTYHSFLDGPNILTSYYPSARSSPLNDSTAARIFYHFVNVTGPSISLYERHPANPSLMFQGRPIPRSQQHIWAYTMPTLALNNQALLHAMLAIGSLHIALLQDGPKTPALRHYHIAIRAVARSVRLPMRRSQPAVLAATLLLGWYELMSGEHQKWSSHLLGATHLLKEIDYTGITRFLKSRKLQQQQARYGNLYHHEMALGRLETLSDGRADSSEAKHEDVNEDLIGMIIGKKLRYNEFGQVLEDLDAPTNRHKVYTPQELEIYETQRDLFWWYCKQDAFQSILSGNRLFMQYDWWSHCPPRAAIGKRDATYGTFDHLILLLGRLAEFAAKDLKRKRKTIQENGGQWRPPSGGPPQPGPTGQNPAHQPGPPQMPNFAGMMPGTEGKTTLPRGFSPPRDSPVSEDDNRSLEEWTVEAEEEWQEIRTAFSILQENFGLDFQPLGPEHCQPIESPFGPALQYRTYSIAGIWIIHYMGLILCHRYHPTMPPAATVAAGLAARQTGVYANEIGRITAAIAPHASQMSQVSTGVGAGLIECTFGLFIAGVQYQNPAQRSWLVQRCFDIIRLTGWQTAEAIAMGCESAWIRTAAIGRGPPYKRITEKKIDQEVWYNTRKETDPLSTGERDRGKIFIARTDRVHYALGLLGVEQSLENLDFDDDYKPQRD